MRDRVEAPAHAAAKAACWSWPITCPARVAGSAGTGKTIVALHRAIYLARQNTDARVLLTTFSDTLVLRLH